jgi:cytochrome c oxidase subunit 2
MLSVQDMLSSAGPQARHIEALWWLMLAVCAVVFIAVLAALAWALWRAPRASVATPADLASLARREGGAAIAVGLAVFVSGLLLVGLMLASFVTDRRLAALGAPELEIEVTAHRWWWEARYSSSDPSQIFVTANELHIPVGKPVLLRLRSDDVIHSLWLPALAGKKDLIPGREATLALQADKAGTYRGVCAEFCGAQHAKMAFIVVADEDFDGWSAAQRKPAATPSTAEQERGRKLFVSGKCGMCHAIQGTSANAQHAPDLTHFASRSTLAAGTVPNTVGHLAGWILDPQGIKPGVNMPANPMPPEELHALLAYLTGLK